MFAGSLLPSQRIQDKLEEFLEQNRSKPTYRILRSWKNLAKFNFFVPPFLNRLYKECFHTS